MTQVGRLRAGNLNSIIIHCTTCLYSHWLRAYAYFGADKINLVSVKIKY